MSETLFSVPIDLRPKSMGILFVIINFFHKHLIFSVAIINNINQRQVLFILFPNKYLETIVSIQINETII